MTLLKQAFESRVRFKENFRTDDESLDLALAFFNSQLRPIEVAKVIYGPKATHHKSSNAVYVMTNIIRQAIRENKIIIMRLDEKK